MHHDKGALNEAGVPDGENIFRRFLNAVTAVADEYEADFKEMVELAEPYAFTAIIHVWGMIIMGNSYMSGDSYIRRMIIMVPHVYM